MVGPLGCQGTLLTQIKLAVSQSPWVPLCRAALQPLIPLSVHRARVALSQVLNPEFALVELQVVGDCPILQFVIIYL